MSTGRFIGTATRASSLSPLSTFVSHSSHHRQTNRPELELVLVRRALYLAGCLLVLVLHAAEERVAHERERQVHNHACLQPQPFSASFAQGNRPGGARAISMTRPSSVATFPPAQPHATAAVAQRGTRSAASGKSTQKDLEMRCRQAGCSPSAEKVGVTKKRAQETAAWKLR